MTTTITVKCTGCDASYRVPEERAGARFSCKACGTKLTVPSPAAERPVVMPAAARPVVTPAGAARPVVAPAPKTKERPHVRPSSHVRGGTPDTTTERTAVARKGVPKVPLLAAGAIVLGVLAYLLWPKGGDAKPDGGSATSTGGSATSGSGAAPVEQTQGQETPKPAFDAAKRIEEIKAEHKGGTSQSLWALTNALAAEVDAWKEKGAPQDVLDALAQARDIAMEDLLEIDPDHAEARARRNEMKYNRDLDPYDGAPYLSTSDRGAVNKAKLLVAMRAEQNKGWIPKSLFETEVKPLIDRLASAKAADEAFAQSDFGKAAKALGESEATYLRDQMKGSTDFRAYFHKPYVILVEDNPGWEPEVVAAGLFSPLKALLETFLKEFGHLGLQPLEVPVPVVYFMSEERYKQYNESIGNVGMNVAAHYEPTAGRLVLNRGVDHEVVIHEGTHQVFDKYTKNMLPHPKQAFWFQEGIAEWFGGSNRTLNAAKEWQYEVGVLLTPRLSQWRDVEKDQFDVDTLIQQTYGKRNDYIMAGPAGQVKIGLVYAQGWFLIYFLNHFNVDSSGMVNIGARGKYADGWGEYLKAELNGKSGKKVFMECLKIDDAGLKKMNEEYLAYYNFVMKKISIKQVQDKKLVAWDKYVNPKGVKTGEKNDDLLIEPGRGGGK